MRGWSGRARDRLPRLEVTEHECLELRHRCARAKAGKRARNHQNRLERRSIAAFSRARHKFAPGRSGGSSLRRSTSIGPSRWIFEIELSFRQVEGVPADLKVRAADWAHVWKTFSAPDAPRL